MTSAVFLVFILLPPIAGALGFYWGYTFAVRRFQLGQIQDYISKHLPDRWAAYKQGVHEGYEQGLRDGQEMPGESA